MKENIFSPIVRMGVSVSQNEIDQKEETEQGKAHSVRELFEDYVLGRLDPSQIGGDPSYDPEDSDVVDPFNSFGVTFEQASSIHDAASSVFREARRVKNVANASADKQQQVDGQKKEHSSESANEGQTKA